MISIDEYLRYKPLRKAKVIIYTAISNNYDNLIQHKYICKDFDYVCFSDTKIENNGIWEIFPLDNKNFDNNRNSKFYKIFADKLFPDYQYSLWIDGNIDVLDNTLEKRINELINNDQLLSVNQHFIRNCVYEEADVCMKGLKDSPEIIYKQVQFLLEENFPKNLGLYEMNIIFRKHNSKLIIQLMLDWWDIIMRFSKRDQLSFMYVLWKNSVACAQMFKINPRKQKAFAFYDHNAHSFSSLYIDTGEGFSVDKLVLKKILFKYNSKFKIKYNLEKFGEIKKVKLSLMKDILNIKINRIQIKNANKNIKKDFFNEKKITKHQEFDLLTTSPQNVILIFKENIKIEEIEINGEIYSPKYTDLASELMNTKKSLAWKLGRIITFLPRKIREKSKKLKEIRAL